MEKEIRIIVEGPVGIGKTALSASIKRYLESNHIDVAESPDVNDDENLIGEVLAPWHPRSPTYWVNQPRIVIFEYVGDPIAERDEKIKQMRDALTQFVNGLDILTDGPDDSDRHHAEDMLVKAFKLAKEVLRNDRQPQPGT